MHDELEVLREERSHLRDELIERSAATCQHLLVDTFGGDFDAVADPLGVGDRDEQERRGVEISPSIRLSGHVRILRSPLEHWAENRVPLQHVLGEVEEQEAGVVRVAQGARVDDHETADAMTRLISLTKCARSTRRHTSHRTTPDPAGARSMLAPRDMRATR